MGGASRRCVVMEGGGGGRLEWEMNTVEESSRGGRHDDAFGI